MYAGEFVPESLLDAPVLAPLTPDIDESTLATDAQDAPPEAASRAQQVTMLIVILVPFLGLLAACYLAWGRGFGLLELGLFLVMQAVTGMGITLGFHRLFTHRSFETFQPIKILLAVFGSMAVQGPLLKWVGVHRQHHLHSDEEDDPHSPNGFGGGVRGVLKGLWHAHMGWMFAPDPPELERHVRDLAADRSLRFISDWFGLWALLGFVIPAVIGGLVTQTWMGALLGFLWGGLVRLFFVHHVTWSVNSICHVWGRRTFQSRDLSRNNLLVGVLAFGEGWHNNHHAFPTSARHGMHWWELDTTYIVIRICEALGLMWRVRRPSAEALEARRIRGQTADQRRPVAR